MPYPATDEQLAVREVVRRFCRQQVMPGAAERDVSGEFPATALKGLAGLDAMGITVPERLGGLGLDTATQLMAIEEVAYADAALASIYTAHYLGLEPLLLFGDEEQQRRYLVPLARGALLAGFALTEPGAGSDIGSMATVAVRDGAGWRLRGSKTFISNAKEAGVLVLFAKTDPDAGFRGISAFVVPQDTPGVTFSPPQDKLGLRSAPTYTVYLDDARLPADALLGEPGRGGSIALEVLNRARIDVAAMANGIAMRALQLATEFATAREQFGRRIRDFQAIQLLLGEMDTRLEAARLLTFWAGDRKDAGDNLRRPASMAKYLATESCFAVVDQALQVCGGAGYLREGEIERLYRDCRVLRIYEGTSQIQLLSLAKDLAVRFDTHGEVA